MQISSTFLAEFLRSHTFTNLYHKTEVSDVGVTHKTTQLLTNTRTQSNTPLSNTSLDVGRSDATFRQEAADGDRHS